jgi:plastocyanin
MKLAPRHLALTLGACLAALLAFAHGASIHYKATVKSVGDKQLTLALEGKKELTVALDENTKFERAGNPATVKDVAVGARVVVHAAAAEGSTPPLALVVKLGASVAKSAGAASATISLAVTEDGFEPGKVTVKKGQPVTLVVTRKTETTCATEIVFDDPPQRAKLPLNQPVTLAFTPTKTGELKYGCGMQKMVGGVILVE